jgi:hypothetical protein
MPLHKTINKLQAALLGVAIAPASLMLLLTNIAQASSIELQLSCHLIPIDYPGFPLEDIQDKTVTLSAANASAKPLFSKNSHTFIVGVNRIDITDAPYILDFYLEVKPPVPAAPALANTTPGWRCCIIAIKQSLIRRASWFLNAGNITNVEV